MSIDNDKYIGDGVYASFDGYQIWIAVNDHTNKVVALNTEVMEQLINYYNSLKAKSKKS